MWQPNFRRKRRILARHPSPHLRAKKRSAKAVMLTPCSASRIGSEASQCAVLARYRGACRRSRLMSRVRGVMRGRAQVHMAGRERVQPHRLSQIERQKRRTRFSREGGLLRTQLFYLTRSATSTRLKYYIYGKTVLEGSVKVRGVQHYLIWKATSKTSKWAQRVRKSAFFALSFRRV